MKKINNEKVTHLLVNKKTKKALLLDKNEVKAYKHLKKEAKGKGRKADAARRMLSGYTASVVFAALAFVASPNEASACDRYASCTNNTSLEAAYEAVQPVYNWNTVIAEFTKGINKGIKDGNRANYLVQIKSKATSKTLISFEMSCFIKDTFWKCYSN